MDENQMGPNTNTIPVHKLLRVGPCPRGRSSLSAIVGAWVQSTVGATCRTQGRVKHTGKKFFMFFCCFFFGALISSPLLGIPGNAGVM